LQWQQDGDDNGSNRDGDGGNKMTEIMAMANDG